MSRGTPLAQDNRRSVLQWAVQRRTPLCVSILSEGRWCSLRSQFMCFDPDRELLEIAYPICSGVGPPPEITPGDQLGISFRRGHKKCIFLSPVVMRRTGDPADGETTDTLLIRVPPKMRELQRRAYQRANLPSDYFIAVKVWQGGVPSPGETSWPLCAGRLGNVSVGGLLVDIRADQNPRLTVGDIVGLEITALQGHRPLLAEAQYRHCVATGQGRIGLGLQFLGLEHDLPGRASIMEIADFVRRLQRDLTHRGRSNRS